MKYKYICNKCNIEKEVNIPMSESIEHVEICTTCSSPMNKVYTNSLIVPEFMKSSEVQDMSYTNNILKTRPSGKTKTLY